MRLNHERQEDANDARCFAPNEYLGVQRKRDDAADSNNEMNLDFKMNEKSFDIAMGFIRRERAAQDAKWGEQNHDPEYWLAILVEEVGEVAAALCKKDRHNYLMETIQVAAVATAMIECVTRNSNSNLER